MPRHRRLGLLGGSFNPVHYAHLLVAERAVEVLRLDRLLLVPSADTPMKDPATLAPAQHRLAMARLAVKGNPRVGVCDLEVRRGGTSWTIDTVEALAPTFDRCFLVIGTDAAARLAGWHRIRELAGLAAFAVVVRPGFRVPRLPRYIENTRVPAPLMEISASEIRRRVRGGRSVRYLLPDAVARYIEANGLYR